jgi:hypothetical protein
MFLVRLRLLLPHGEHGCCRRAAAAPGAAAGARPATAAALLLRGRRRAAGGRRDDGPAPTLLPSHAGLGRGAAPLRRPPHPPIRRAQQYVMFFVQLRIA